MRLATVTVLGWMAQVLSLAGIGAFVGALVVNSVVFDGWGLNFLQFATFGDVVMSGLSVIQTARDPLLFVLAGLSLQRWFMPARRWFIWWLLLSFTLCVAVLWFGASSSMLAGQAPRVSILAAHTVFMAVAAMVCGLGFELLNRLLTSKMFRMGGRVDRNAIFTATLLGLISFLPLVEAKKLINTGYHSDLSAQVAECDPLPARVLWTGERAVILRCGDGQTKVIYGPQGAVLSGPSEKSRSPAKAPALISEGQ